MLEGGREGCLEQLEAVMGFVVLDGGFFLRFIAVIFMVTNKRGLLGRECEAIKLDHPQTSASIRNTEGEKVGVLAILSSLKICSRARGSIFRLLELFKFVCFLFYFCLFSAVALLFAACYFLLAYQYPPFPFLCLILLQ